MFPTALQEDLDLNSADTCQDRRPAEPRQGPGSHRTVCSDWFVNTGWRQRAGSAKHHGTCCYHRLKSHVFWCRLSQMPLPGFYRKWVHQVLIPTHACCCVRKIEERSKILTASYWCPCRRRVIYCTTLQEWLHQQRALALRFVLFPTVYSLKTHRMGAKVSMAPQFPRSPWDTFTHLPRPGHLRLLWPFPMHQEHHMSQVDRGDLSPGEPYPQYINTDNRYCKGRILSDFQSLTHPSQRKICGSLCKSLSVSFFLGCRGTWRGTGSPARWCPPSSSYTRSSQEQMPAVTRRPTVLRSRQAREPLLQRNSTNRGYASQHRRVRKPFCYWKN